MSRLLSEDPENPLNRWFYNDSCGTHTYHHQVPSIRPNWPTQVEVAWQDGQILFIPFIGFKTPEESQLELEDTLALVVYLRSNPPG